MASLAFEIIPSDFDGSTDATDHRIAWVEAPSIEVVKAALHGTQARISPLPPSYLKEPDMDYRLPRDRDALHRFVVTPDA